MDTEAQVARQRKSLAVDQKTYDLLQEVCFEVVIKVNTSIQLNFLTQSIPFDFNTSRGNI
jgi:hypothetical protein